MPEYIIMLDRLKEAHDDQWPVSKRKSTLKEIREVTQVPDRPTLLPKSMYRTRSIEKKTVTNSRTGKREKGAIYTLSQKI